MTPIDTAEVVGLIRGADGLLITAGAGMGIDSGLPDFRGPQGFWQAYPALGRANMQFQDIASPDAFNDRPELAWGFYGHRLALYRATVPHRGFEILRNIADRLLHGAFVFTSNVDGQFQKAGFPDERIHECHGSIHLLQCTTPCSQTVWPADFVPEVNEDACLMTSPLPHCPNCGALARPNILMFHDWYWEEHRARRQADAYTKWRAQVDSLVILEFGAGTHIPSVRLFSEEQARFGKLIRINPRESKIPSGVSGISIEMAALDAMLTIDDALFEAGYWDGA